MSHIHTEMRSNLADVHQFRQLYVTRAGRWPRHGRVGRGYGRNCRSPTACRPPDAGGWGLGQPCIAQPSVRRNRRSVHTWLKVTDATKARHPSVTAGSEFICPPWAGLGGDAALLAQGRGWEAAAERPASCSVRALGCGTCRSRSARPGQAGGADRRIRARAGVDDGGSANDTDLQIGARLPFDLTAKAWDTLRPRTSPGVWRPPPRRGAVWPRHRTDRIRR